MQLGNRFADEYSARAIAWGAMASELGIKKGNDSNSYDYSKDFIAGVVSDKFNGAVGDETQELENTVYDNGFGVIKLSPQIKRAADPQNEIFAKSDGIILNFNPDTAKENFWRNLYILTSAIVGEQTHDKYKFQKPLYLVNSNGVCDDFIKLIYDFHYLGTVPEDPLSLLRVVGTVDEAIQGLQKERKFYRRYHLPGYATRKDAYEIEGRPSPYGFNVGILLSASSENSLYLNETRKLAKGLIKNDIGIYSGGGAYGPMGVITDTVYNMRASHRAFHGASNVPHIMSGEGDVRDFVSQFQLSRDIYERMEYIARADSFAVLSGGTGTLQEWALLALLAELSQNPENEYAGQLMRDKSIIIVNTKIEHRGKKRGFYDGVLSIIPENSFKDLNISVVETAEQAIAKIETERQLKLQRKGSRHAVYTNHNQPLNLG